MATNKETNQLSVSKIENLSQQDKYKCAVLSFIVGDYEKIHEVEYFTPDFQYVMVTDNTAVTSTTWEVKYVENVHPEDPFDLCWKVRYNPFDYVDADVVIKIDGSMQVTGNLNYLVDFFNSNNYDICLEMHPTRNDMVSEYQAWVQQRNFPIEQANKCLSFMNANRYDVRNDKGLYQFNFMMQRNNAANNNFNNTCVRVLHDIAPEGKQVDRLDQTIGSFLINKFYNYMKVLPVSQTIALSGKYFKWYPHGSNTPFAYGNYDYCQPYLYNQPVNTIYMME